LHPDLLAPLLPAIVSGSLPSRASILGPVDEGNAPRQNPVLQAAVAKYTMLPETSVLSVFSVAKVRTNNSVNQCESVSNSVKSVVFFVPSW
jgi:hypothetical protein